MFYLEKTNGKLYIKKNENGFYVVEDFKVRPNELDSIVKVLSQIDEDSKRAVYYGIASSIANRIKIDLNITDYVIEESSIEDLLFCFSKMIKDIAITINETVVLPFDFSLFMSILKMLVEERLAIFSTHKGLKPNPISILLKTGLPIKDIDLVREKTDDFMRGYFLLRLY